MSFSSHMCLCKYSHGVCANSLVKSSWTMVSCVQTLTHEILFVWKPISESVTQQN